jgi:DNA-dependent protein kinase catalytic subunit
MMNEIKATKHAKAKYSRNLESIVRGDESRVRRSMRENNLPLADQVDCLIDMASDPNILGRSWTGWGPYA